MDSSATTPKPTAKNPADKNKIPWWVLTTYFAEGFPFYTLRNVIPYFLKQAGHTNTISGLASLAFSPWAFKALWAPLVDLYSTKKRWIVITEICIATIFLLVGVWIYLNPEVSLQGGFGISFWVLMFVGAILSSTQDIAVDANYIENLSQRQQKLWSGTRTAAYRAAIIAGKSGIIVLAGLYSWPLALFVAAVLFYATAIFHFFNLPQTSAQPIASRPSVVEEFKHSITTFLTKDSAVLILCFAFFYKIGDAMLFSMSNNFLDDLGVETIYVGVVGSTDLIMALSGALLGGWLVSRFTLSKCILLFALIMNSADLIYALYATLDLSASDIRNTAFLITGFEQFVGGIGTGTYMVAFMLFARGNHTASHYALLTSIMALEVLCAAPIGGFMADLLGWSHFFIFCFIVGIPGMIITVFLIPTIKKMELESE